MQELSSNSLTRTTTMNFPKKNSLKSKLNNSQHTLEVEEKEENEIDDALYHSKHSPYVILTLK